MPWRHSSVVDRGAPLTSPRPSQRASLPGPGAPAAMMASQPIPPRSEDAAVCCMCGDHGLARELFRCRTCRVRLQHSYCSDLYPRATAYRRCNWCLREPPPPVHREGGAAGHAAASAANDGNNKPAEETKRKAAADEERRQQRREVCSPSARRPPPELGCPVKKKKKKRKAGKEGTSSDAGEKTGSCVAPGESNKEVTRVRVKARRYKLLAEVISC